METQTQLVSAKDYDISCFLPLRVESSTEQLRLLSIIFFKHPEYKSILEIGIGKGVLRHVVKFLRPDLEYVAIDNNPELNPDLVGSVTDLPFKEKSFDITVCCEVLEHLPFAEFLTALKEIKAVTKHKVILSLPDLRRRFEIALCLAHYGWKSLKFNILNRKARKYHEHCWEIGEGATINDVKNHIKEAGFEIENIYRLHNIGRHTFFVLSA